MAMSEYIWGEYKLKTDVDWKKTYDRDLWKSFDDYIEKSILKICNQSIFGKPVRPVRGFYDVPGGKIEYDGYSVWFTPTEKPIYHISFTVTKPHPVISAINVMHRSPHATWHSIVDNENGMEKE